MDDNRTPYERAAGLSGSELEQYRETKRKLNISDPVMFICRSCEAKGRDPHVFKLTDRGVCVRCIEEEDAAANKAAMDAFKARCAEHQPAGGLIDKVRRAEKKEQADKEGRRQERWGAEKAYPDD
jgi:hypothetical protein